MSTEYGPIGKHVADPTIRAQRYREYDTASMALEELIEITLERVDDIMGEAQTGCSIDTDGLVQQHRYEREFKVSLVWGKEPRQRTGLSILHVAYREPVRHVAEQYFLTLRQYDLEGRWLMLSSFMFRRYVHSGVEAQRQHSLDLPDWITYPDGGPEALWHDVVPYEMGQLDGELYTLESLQRYDDEVMLWDRERGLV